MINNKIKDINKKYFSVFTLLFSDILAVVLGFFVAYFLRDRGIFRIFFDQIQPLTVYLNALPIAIIILLILFATSGLYEPKKRITKISELYASLRMITLWILLIMAGSYLYKYNFSRIIVLQLYFFTSLFIIVGRLFVRNLHLNFFKNGLGRVNIAIIGSGKNAKDLAKKLERYRHLGFNFIGFIDDKEDKNMKILCSIESVNKIIKKYAIDEIYIANPAFSQEEMLNIIAKCKDKKIKFKITSNIFDLITGSVDITNLESIPSLDLSRVNFPFWKIVYKRVFDVFLSASGLILTFPFWITVGVLIKIESKGPILFTQERIGINGDKFKIYKFRTMHNEISPYNFAPKDKNDGRITKVGKFLRRTSLDELPQFINIIKGEMSLVGPRPEMAFIAKKYNLWQKRRLTVKPGLTGLWQILGRKDLPLSENLEYDFYYINNQSFILDIAIILKTVPVVLQGKGAY